MLFFFLYSEHFIIYLFIFYYYIFLLNNCGVEGDC